MNVSSGATLQVQDGINPKITLTLNGAGVSGGGALLNYAGNSTLAGRVILGSSATIESNSGTLTLASPVPINAPTCDLTAEAQAISSSKPRCRTWRDSSRTARACSP